MCFQYFFLLDEYVVSGVFFLFQSLPAKHTVRWRSVL